MAHKNEGAHSKEVVLLVFNLLFLYFLTLNGLARSLSDLSGLTKKSGAIPRGNWLLIVCGELEYCIVLDWIGLCYVMMCSCMLYYDM